MEATKDASGSRGACGSVSVDGTGPSRPTTECRRAERPRLATLPRSRRILAPAMAAVLALGLAGCGAEPGEGAAANARTGGPGGPGGQRGPGAGGEARATPVSVRVVQPGDLEVTLRASTNLRAREQVEVVPRQSGNVVEVLVEEGDRVRAGQPLAQLDDAEWRLQADQSEARAAAASEAAARARSLQDLALVSEQEVERLVSEARVAEAELGLARLRVDQAQIRAPIAGTVTHRYVERGQLVNTSEPAFGLADLDRLEALVNVPEREAARVQVGQRARILLQEGAGPVAVGRVERIRPVVDAASGTVQVTVSVPAGNETPLRPGQFVNVDLVTETLTERITLPRTSVLVDGAAPRVFLVSDGRAVEREVQLGYSRGEAVEIRSGVQPGDTVVVVGQDNLRPNTPVRMMEIDGRPFDVPIEGVTSADETPGAREAQGREAGERSAADASGAVANGGDTHR